MSECSVDDLPSRCQRLWAEALAFAGRQVDPLGYDGTLGSLLKIYELHPSSSFHRLKPETARGYVGYLGKLSRAYGARRVANITGLDVMRWHEAWRGADDHVAAAFMALAVLKTALSFGQVCGFKGCAELRAMTGALRLPGPKPRQEAPDWRDVVSAMKVARDMGFPGAAFCYSLQFEAAVRQYDLTGVWVPLSDPRPSVILGRGFKWLGPTWANIDQNLVLSLTPSKTEKTTGKGVKIDLHGCPLVMAELAMIPIERRAGPLIVNDKPGLPFVRRAFDRLWWKVRVATGLPSKVWNRDLRAGGLTEASQAGATADDRAKLAAHSKRMTQSTYDRDVLVSSNRVAEARAKFRERNKEK